MNIYPAYPLNTNASNLEAASEILEASKGVYGKFDEFQAFRTLETALLFGIKRSEIKRSIGTYLNLLAGHGHLLIINVSMDTSGTAIMASPYEAIQDYLMTKKIVSLIKEVFDDGNYSSKGYSIGFVFLEIRDFVNLSLNISFKYKAQIKSDFPGIWISDPYSPGQGFCAAFYLYGNAKPSFVNSKVLEISKWRNAILFNIRIDSCVKTVLCTQLPTPLEKFDIERCADTIKFFELAREHNVDAIIADFNCPFDTDPRVDSASLKKNNVAIEDGYKRWTCSESYSDVFRTLSKGEIIKTRGEESLPSIPCSRFPDLKEIRDRVLQDLSSPKGGPLVKCFSKAHFVTYIQQAFNIVDDEVTTGLTAKKVCDTLDKPTFSDHGLFFMII